MHKIKTHPARLLGAATALLCIPAALAGCTDPYVEQFGGTTTKPAVSQAMPAATTTKPAVSQAMPAATTTKPAVSQAMPAATTTAAAPATTETLPPAPGRRHGSTLGSTPEAALTRFATFYANWTARTVAFRLERLSQLAIGDASVSLAETAERSRADKDMVVVGAYNRGSVASVARETGGSDVYIVVTYEESGAQGGDYEGLPASYRVTLAKVQEIDGGWTVSSWEPQS
jgi:hypothetical protein